MPISSNDNDLELIEPGATHKEVLAVAISF